SGEPGDVEDGFEITVPFDEPGWRGLELGFSKLRFDEQRAELQVDFSAIDQSLIAGCGGWCGWCFENPGLKSETWGTRGLASLNLRGLVETGFMLPRFAAFANSF